MRRRAFIAGLGSAVAWPLVAPAQQGKLVRLGYLEGGGTVGHDPAQSSLARLQSSRRCASIEGRDYVLEERSPRGRWIASKPTRRGIGCASGRRYNCGPGGEAAIRAPSARRAKYRLSWTISADPIGSGLVADLAHPGGNLAGMSALLPPISPANGSNWSRTLLPKARRVSVLWNPEQSVKGSRVEGTPQIGAQSVGLALLPSDAQTPAELDRALAAIKHEQPDGMIVLGRNPCRSLSGNRSSNSPSPTDCPWWRSSRVGGVGRRPCKLRHQPG